MSLRFLHAARPPLKFAGFKIEAHFRQRRISLRLSLRDQRGLLLQPCMCKTGLVFKPLQAFQSESDGSDDGGQGQGQHPQERWRNDP